MSLLSRCIMAAAFGFMATQSVLCVPQMAHSEELLEISMNFKSTDDISWEAFGSHYGLIKIYELEVETPLGTEEWSSMVITGVNPQTRLVVAAPTLEALKKMIELSVNGEDIDMEKEDILVIAENIPTGAFGGKGSYKPAPFLPRYFLGLSGNTKTKKLYSDVDDDNIDDYKFKLTITGLDSSIQTRRRAPATRLGGGLIEPQEGGL